MTIENSGRNPQAEPDGPDERAGQRESALRLIAGRHPADRGEQATQAEFAAAFDAVDAPLRRDDAPAHATASCFAFDPSLRSILLVLHRKGRFWVQPGGHLEPSDRSVPAAALRELAEETGVVPPEPTDVVAVDLDHHALASGFGRCASHLDFGVAVLLDPAARLTVSAESDDVRWWPVDALPENEAPGLTARIRAMIRRIEGHDRA
ncbi:MAG: NUDIX domain-containing protein [Herbiconiux sp.]|nr:NUDIX domain-containing protein [Herbiconiux sp.]